MGRVVDRVHIDVRDYREADGVHDAVLGVEMIEAVGARHWPEYFRTLHRLPAPGGRAGPQAITMPHDRLLASRGTHTWIEKYIFPGGLLPSTGQIAKRCRACTRPGAWRPPGECRGPGLE